MMETINPNIQRIRIELEGETKKIAEGLSLKAGGIGLVDKEGKVISNTERGILENLLNKYVEPKDRK
jgi:hypothetical protein